MDNLDVLADWWQTRQKTLNLSETNLIKFRGPSKLWVAGSIPAGVTNLNTLKTLGFPSGRAGGLDPLNVRSYAAKCRQKQGSVAESANGQIFSTYAGNASNPPLRELEFIKVVTPLSHTSHRISRSRLECFEVIR